MRSCQSALCSVYRLLVIILFISGPLLSKAQSGDIPCNGGDDYDSNCPLDTWVIIIVVIAGLAAAIHLHNKQKNRLFHN
jgi:hypothetical protein